MVGSWWWSVGNVGWGGGGVEGWYGGRLWLVGGIGVDGW